ncbi:hypothetical protein FDH47_gp55 [Arthrobacter phage Brent]|uniref:Uncharacterized protein n=2 Tax=Marthavirus brent TaxID=1980948 RepID=A0A222Z2X6_9CAUD|nr:hypothetical protein FDH47_gp55 [Arthrobacter phage Brent]ALF01266.1 hypothetical protein SEA_BRENT_55 [Arthrobacter phage Brent]ASR78156.1 hypothetical protein SEA_FRANZY_55 [Arthrobacter phage Franzy]
MTTETVQPPRKTKITISFEQQDIAAIPPLLTTDAVPSELAQRVAAHANTYMRLTKHARWWRIDWPAGSKKGAITSTRSGSLKDKPLIGFTAKRGWL